MILWVEGREVLTVRVVDLGHVVTSLLSAFFEVAQMRRRFPRRVRVATTEMVEALQRMMPPFVTVIRAPTPEINRAIEQTELHGGKTSRLIPTPSRRFLDVPSLNRIALELLARNPWSQIASKTIFGISSHVLGLQDAVINLARRDNDLPQLSIIPEQLPVAELARRVRERGVAPIDEHLHRLFLTYVRAPETGDDDRNRLRQSGWIPPSTDPHLMPIGGALDGPGERRALTASEQQVLRAAAFAIIGMYDEPFPKFPTPDEVLFSFVLKFEDNRVANVQLRRFA